MFRLLTCFALAAVLVAASGSAAQDAKADKKAGVWTREASGVEIKLDFTGEKGTLKASMSRGADGVTATCKYEVVGGVLKGEVTAVAEKGNFPNPPTVGFGFGFKWAAKGDTAELSDLTGNFDPAAKRVIEGEYKRAMAKKE